MKDSALRGTKTTLLAACTPTNSTLTAIPHFGRACYVAGSVAWPDVDESAVPATPSTTAPNT